MAKDALRAIVETAFQDYGRPLEMVNYFKYIGHVLTLVGNDWPEVVGNLRKARKSLSWMASNWGSKAANPEFSGIFSKAGVHSVLNLSRRCGC